MMAVSYNDDQLECDNAPDWSALNTRLRSFRSFPRATEVSAEKLALAGFYFTGESDRVQCFSCQQTVENWQQGDAPIQRHHTVAPACTFLNCVHRRSLSGASHSVGSIYDDDDEDEAMQFSLRRGEVVDESTYTKVPHMKSEDARRRTFDNWPSRSPVQPHALAQAGLFYVSNSNDLDLVQCFCCGGMLSHWEDDDDPWNEHNKHYPNCYFILGHDVGNIPSEQTWQQSSGHSSRSMESFEERLDTFRDNPHCIESERLARAGFYAKGEGDRVLCFKCGGGIKDWQPDEDPWEEHAKNYPGCSFLLTEKGQEFVNSVQLRNPRDRHQNGLGSRQDESNVMQLDIAQKAVEMGFDPVKVERTILEKIRLSGMGYSTVEALIPDIPSGDGDSETCQRPENEDPLKKLEKLQREKLCKVCMDKDVSIVFIPCGHLVTCKKCADSLSKCPICCAAITQKIKTYST